MAALQIPLNEVVYFDVITSNSTGAATDADATPTFAVYEESTDTDIGIGGNFTKRTGLTGNYRASFTASTANGFEVGKWYTVVGSATVGSVAGKCICMSFRVTAAEAVAGVPDVNITYINGTTATSGETVNANVVSISGDTDAADNLEAAYDGTGYAGGTTKQQVVLADAAHGGSAASLEFGGGVSMVNNAGPGLYVEGSTHGVHLKGGSGMTDYTIFTEGANGYDQLTGVSLDLGVVSGIASEILTDTSTDGVVVAAASKSGYSLTANTGLGNQTANITGNLSGSVGSVTGEVTANVAKWNGSAVVTPTVAGVPEVDITHVGGAPSSSTATIAANVTQWNGTNVATPTVAGVPEVDLTHINGTAASGSSTIDANVVSMAPNTVTASALASDAVTEIQSGLSTGGGSSASSSGVNFAANADNTGGSLKSVVFVGSQTSTYASTASENGTYHVITDSGTTPDIDIVYKFSMGSGRLASKILWKGYVTDSDTITVQAFNGSTWDTRATITGTASTSNTSREITLLNTHTLTGAEVGDVYIRFTCSGQSGIVLNTDELLVCGVTAGSSTGYSDGAVWVKATGVAGSTPDVHGTADNPCPWANALAVASAKGLTRFRIAEGETVTLAATLTSASLIGKNWNLVLGSQAISGCYIEGATVTGSATASVQPMFVDCQLGNGGSAAVTLPPFIALRCGINCISGYPLTAATAGNGQYVLTDCYSLVAGSDVPYFNFAPVTGTSGVHFRRWSGGSNITLDNNCTLNLEIAQGGSQTITTGGASCEIRGICRSISIATSGSETIQIACVTGPIALSGTSTATINIYGVCSQVSNSSSGTTINTYADIHADIITATATLNKVPLSDGVLTWNTTAQGSISSSVWNALTASYGTAGTYGALIESGNVGGGNIVATATVSDKTGFKLASDGLDLVATTAPTGAATNFREMVVQTWRRFFKKATKTDTQLVTYADNGTTPITTQAINDDGSTETQGAA